MAGGGAAWIAAMRHIANEGRMWVVSTGNLFTASDLPDDLRAIGEYDEGQILNPGGSLIVDPSGSLVAGPILDEAGILYADCDPDVALISRRMFDAVGHYSRGDLFKLHVAGTPFAIPIGDDDPAAALDDHVWRVKPR
jgi:nitrilase